jgi:hypothetical protein
MNPTDFLTHRNKDKKAANRSLNRCGAEKLRCTTDLKTWDRKQPDLASPEAALLPARGLGMTTWREIVAALLLAVSVGLLSFYGATLVPDAIIDVYDVWFSADPPRVYANMTSRDSEHSRTSVHPIYSLLTYPPTLPLRKLASVPPPIAVQSVLSAVAALWTLTLFVILRRLGCRLIDASLFTLLGASSAAAIFWFTVPETYAAGSLTILLAVLVAVVADRVQVPSMTFVLTSALTLSVTVTNWMAGLVLTKARFSWKQTLAISAGGFMIVAILWGAQKLIFPTTPFFMPDRYETNYMLVSSPTPVLQSFFFHSVIMPTIHVKERPDRVSPDAKYVLATQQSSAGSASTWGRLSVITWATLLGLGCWGLRRLSDLPTARAVLLGIVAGQLALHLVYGSETFLYSLNFAPLLVIVAACSTLTPARPLARMLGGIAVIAFLLNNLQQFRTAIALFFDHLDRL